MTTIDTQCLPLDTCACIYFSTLTEIAPQIICSKSWASKLKSHLPNAQFVVLEQNVEVPEDLEIGVKPSIVISDGLTDNQIGCWYKAISKSPYVCYNVVHTDILSVLRQIEDICKKVG